MKKFIKIIGLLALVLALGACSKTNTSSDSSSSSTVASTSKSTKVSGIDKDTLAVVIPSADHGWLAGVSYYAQQEGKKLGLKKFKVITSDNVNDQASQIDELISQKVGGIVLEPYSSELSVAARKVVKNKIPLVIFDRKVKADYNGFVAGSNTEIGTTVANFLGEKLNGQGTIAVLSVPSSGSVSSERVDGFKKVMKEKYPNIKLVSMTADAFTQEAGLKTAQDMLTANKKVDAVFSIDDESSLGILQAINEANRTDVKYLSGVGGSQSYINKIKNQKDGLTLFTATYSPTMIQTAIKEAKDVMDGKSIKKNNIIPTTIITKDNANKYINEKSPY